jgi:hypothetical protein
MNTWNLAVSIISYNRSTLLDLCLESVSKALGNRRVPVYLVLQDATIQDEEVVEKYKNLISGIVHVGSENLHTEELINNNRIKAWEIALNSECHDYVICLEDDVEVSKDIFDFTEQVLEQNINLSDFRGINYGSFETDAGAGTYSRIRYGLHGPASLISRETAKKLNLRNLQRFHGKIAWDSWVEPILKKGFLATSNLSRYRDNGINGTHTSTGDATNYFRKLNASFEIGQRIESMEIINSDIQHSLRKDCHIYRSQDRFKYSRKYFVIRAYQYYRVTVQKLKGAF